MNSSVSASEFLNSLAETIKQKAPSYRVFLFFSLVETL